jgi:hypothetical protein
MPFDLREADMWTEAEGQEPEVEVEVRGRTLLVTDKVTKDRELLLRIPTEEERQRDKERIQRERGDNPDAN